MPKTTFLTTLPLFFVLALPSGYYPVDGYRHTGIRRLERLRLRLAGELKGRVPVAGARKRWDEIKLHLHQTAAETLNTLPQIDSTLQNQIETLFARRHKSYSLALMEITPGQPMRYAELRPELQYQPGSVGKIAIAVGMFAELEKLFPDSVKYRTYLLRSRVVEADRWIQTDHHKVPIFDPVSRKVEFRAIRAGDRFTLYEWLDHMLSPSSNAAASIVWKEAMLMRKFGRAYPPSRAAEGAFFDQTPKAKLQEIALSVVSDPLRALGIADRDWRLGSFFTRVGKQIVPRGGSHASPRGLLMFLMRLEQGRVVDDWTSLELKRLLYMTEKRIRYASAPRLNRSAVYFKSGSLYSCKKEQGYKCGKYRGNRQNYMNSVAIVEKPEGKVYMVALMSNVLRVNSAVEHQSLATFIDKTIMQQSRK
ncbi:MAG: hypothetical protein ACE5IY_13250 [bacterium]